MSDVDWRLFTHYKIQDAFDGIDGVNLYFRPPSSLMITYPCVIYDLKVVDVRHSDNQVYSDGERYEVSYITSTQDDRNWTRLRDIPGSRWIRNFNKENLYHHIFEISVGNQ